MSGPDYRKMLRGEKRSIIEEWTDVWKDKSLTLEEFTNKHIQVFAEIYSERHEYYLVEDRILKWKSVVGKWFRFRKIKKVLRG